MRSLRGMCSLLIMLGACTGELAQPENRWPVTDTIRSTAQGEGDGGGWTAAPEALADATVQSAHEAGPSDAPLASGLDVRPANGCVALPRPIPAGGSITTQPFGGSGYPGAVITDMKRGPARVPGWFGVEKEGSLFVRPDGANAVQNLSHDSLFPGLQTGGERGVIGLAVDPAYPSASAPERVRVFVMFSGTCGAPVAGETCTHLRRVDLRFSGSGSSTTFSPARCDVAGACEDLIILGKSGANHNGGAMLFGQDGYLYVTFGDGGNDGQCNSQNMGTPMGKMFRLDVHDTSGAAYGIPASNPFASNPVKCDRNTMSATGAVDTSHDGACPELVVAGLRNPFRITQDLATGHIWIGDVGFNAYEEVNSFDPASLGAGSVPNFGWPLREGPEAQREPNATGVPTCNTVASAGLRLPASFSDPRFYYYIARDDQPDSLGTSVQAIGVYRGTLLGSRFAGRFLLGDVGSSDVYVIKDPYSRTNLHIHKQTVVDPDHPDYFVNLGAVPHSALGYAPTEGQELLQFGLNTPNLVTLSGASEVTFPSDLAATGCVDPGDPARPAAGLIPYDVIAPLWSDGAEKERFLGIPDGTTIRYGANCAGLSESECLAQGDLELPVGSVVVKLFRRNGRLLETRLMMRHDDGDWAGYSYVWNEAQTAATLIDGATELPGREWTAPSRDQCLSCHTSAAGRTLGLEAAQLNRTFTYPATGRSANQLETWAAIGLLDPLPGPSDELPRLTEPARVGAEAARSYLHANCAHCHRPGSSVPSAMDLRSSVPLARMNVCNVRSLEGSTFLVAPGQPQSSLIPVRMHARTGDLLMPPIGRRRVDGAGVALVETWIDHLAACP